MHDLASGTLERELSRLAAELGFDVEPDQLAPFAPTSIEEVGSEYIRLFDLPVDGPPSPLYGGLLGGDRRQTMEELLRLYRHFGLSTAGAEVSDLPDSIPTVLEFLQYLTHREAAAATPEEASPFRAAERDLLERHLGRWLPRIVQQVATRDPAPLYLAALALADRFVRHELQALQERNP